MIEEKGGEGLPAVTALESKSVSESLKEKPDDVLSTSPHSKLRSTSAVAACWTDAGCSNVMACAAVGARCAADFGSRADMRSARRGGWDADF